MYYFDFIIVYVCIDCIYNLIYVEFIERIHILLDGKYIFDSTFAGYIKNIDKKRKRRALRE